MQVWEMMEGLVGMAIGFFLGIVGILGSILSRIFGVMVVGLILTSLVSGCVVTSSGNGTMGLRTLSCGIELYHETERADETEVAKFEIDVDSLVDSIIGLRADNSSDDLPDSEPD